MKNWLSKHRSSFRKASYWFAKNDGVEFALSLVIILLALGWLFASEESDLSGVVDLTIFFAIVATMLLQVVARFAKNRIVNWAEDDIKLDTNYKKLAKRYPVIVYPDGASVDPLITGDNSRAASENAAILQKHGNYSATWRLPVILDHGLPGETLFSINDEESQYQLPESIREHRAALMEAHATSNIYNQLNVRVNEWFMEDDCFQLNTSRTTYFDSLATNRAMDFMWPTGTTTRDQYQYGPFPPKLSAESPLSNHLGFNGLVITSDGFVPFIRRNKIVSIGKNTYGTSVGASLKTKYALNHSMRFDLRGLENAIVQEIKDELKLEATELVDFSVNSGVIAAYRDLVEGGKPQLLFFARTLLSSNELERRFLGEIAMEKKNKESWDVEARELEDGDEIIWLSLGEMRRAAFCEDAMACAGMCLRMTPSSVASVLLFLRYGPQE